MLKNIPLSAMIGLIITGTYFLAAIFASVIAPYGMAETVGDVWEPSSSQFWLGTDQIGRDLLTRMIFGGQTTIFIATAAISYYGPFTGTFRDNLVTQWIEKCNELEIPSSEHFDMSEVMGDPMEIQNWNLNMLPTDPVSVASGILVKYG